MQAVLVFFDFLNSKFHSQAVTLSKMEGKKNFKFTSFKQL
jgi:hypothetical protein